MASCITFSFFLLSIIIEIASPFSFRPDPRSLEATSFSSILFNRISNKNENSNLIISPFSIQSALTLLYMGAEGDTAEEFQHLLQYNTPNKYEAAANFSRILNSMNSNELVQLKTANRIYSRFDLVPKFNEVASKYFQSEAEVVNFKLKEPTANKINAWVEENTNNKIKNLISPNAIDDYTTAVLVNAIYFKAQWTDQFSVRNTKKRPFKMSATKFVDVDTMSGEITCKYAAFTDLDATAIELQYEDSNVVMDIILPNKGNGLKDLERRLSVVDLEQRFQNITEQDVDVRLPKFKIEFETGLIPVLEEMGMKKSFMYGANFKGIFDTNVPVKISDVVHKAFIEVNELGSEAAASTYFKVQFLMFSQPEKAFTADHPFMFVIRNPEMIFFMGHVKQFEI